jgi:hypothetical protein
VQLPELHTKRRRPRLPTIHKLFWIGLRRLWSRWIESLILVTPRTVLTWYRAGFRLYWKWFSRARAEGQVFEDKILARAEDDDDPTDQVPEEGDPGPRILSHSLKWETWKSFVSRLLEVLRRHRRHSSTRLSGEAMETSASYQARSAPLPYPTGDLRAIQRIAGSNASSKFPLGREGRAPFSADSISASHILASRSIGSTANRRNSLVSTEGGSLPWGTRTGSIERFTSGICGRLGMKFPGPARSRITRAVRHHTRNSFSSKSAAGLPKRRVVRRNSSKTRG